MKIYTRTGDDGTTGLFGGGRVAKTHPRLAAYGTVDEANSAIGLARAELAEQPGQPELDSVLAEIQQDLFVVGADLATPADAKPYTPRITAEDVARLERRIDTFDSQLPALKQFILPGGARPAAALHLARTVCRRAERLTIDAATQNDLNGLTVIYLNRLSDLLFVLARWANQQAGVQESTWSAPVR